MPPQKILAQGAEAIILQENDKIIKDRIKKSYRLPVLDDKIRKQRTKAEKKLLERASKIIACPKPLTEKDNAIQIDGLINNKISANDNEQQIKSNDFKIIMPFIQGQKLSEHLDNFSLTKQKQICEKIGQSIAQLHNSDIIHGDLTTSNMILVEDDLSASQNKLSVNKKNSINYKQPKGAPLLSVDKNSEQSEPLIYFIDFGLGFHSRKFEDKAVDLHLLKQALEARHFKHWETLFNSVIKTYTQENKDAKIILERLKAVEKRGRYKS